MVTSEARVVAKVHTTTFQSCCCEQMLPPAVKEIQFNPDLSDQNLYELALRQIISELQRPLKTVELGARVVFGNLRSQKRCCEEREGLSWGQGET